MHKHTAGIAPSWGDRELHHMGTVYTMGSPKASQSPIKVTPNLIIQSLSVLTSEMVIGDCPSRTALNSYLA